MPWHDSQFVTVVIRRVDATGMTVYAPSMGQTFLLPYTLGVPDEVPHPGEMWVMQRIAVDEFHLYGKAVVGDVNFIELGCLVDCRLAIGRESYVSSTIADIGFSEVWLVIAADGTVCWSGDWTEKSGLHPTDVSFLPLLTMLKRSGIKVYAAISNKLWVGGGKFNQQRANGTVSDHFSFATAKDVICDMVSDLDAKFGNLLDGVGFIDCAVDSLGSIADISSPIAKRFFKESGDTPFSQGGDMDGWVDLQQTVFREFIAAVEDRTRLPISMMISENRYGGGSFPGLRGNMLIEPETFRGGASLSYEQSHSTEAEIESLNYNLASLRSIGGTTPIAQIDVDDVDDWSSFFQAVAYQDCTFILFDDFEKFAEMSAMRRDEFDRGYARWCVTPRYDGESSAIVVSGSASLDSDDQVSWWGDMAGLYQALSRHLGCRIDIIGDDKLDSFSAGYRAVVFPYVTRLSDNDVSRLASALMDDGQVCLVLGGQQLEDIFKTSEPFYINVDSMYVPSEIPHIGGDTLVLDDDMDVAAITQLNSNVSPGELPIASVRSSFYIPTRIVGMPSPVLDMIGMLIASAVDGGTEV